jgi:two-component system, OmpR family, phosphate regulon response regulator PhoB
MSLLLVEADAADRRGLAKLLMEAGYEVDAVGTPRDAQRYLERSLPDLVLLDWRLPGPAHWSVLDALRARPSRPAVLLLTPRPDHADLLPAPVVGIVAHSDAPHVVLEACARALSFAHGRAASGRINNLSISICWNKP